MPLISVTSQIDAAHTTLEIDELEVTAPHFEFDPVVEAAEADARKGAVEALGGARALYRRFGIDPTRYRPSSEALLRRVRRGAGLPRINSLVDVANVISLRYQVPIGLYDVERVSGRRLVIRLGGEGESYAGIGKESVSVAGRICVADADGPCGNPSSDSARTMITTDTASAAWIFFLPVAGEVVDRSAELVARYGRGLVRLL